MTSVGEPGQIAELELRLIGSEQGDPERLAELTYQLRQELLDLAVERVDVRSTGEIATGAKGADALAIGELIVRVSVGVLPALLASVQSWVSRSGQQKLRIKLGEDEIEITGRMSPVERRALIRAFSERRRSG